MKGTVIFFVCCLFIGFSVVTTLDREAVARTTKEETSVEESICDELIGATPGLYGLCVAFHAKNCEPDFTKDDPFEGCVPSSPKLLELYHQLRQPGDPDMPGVYWPCPCWSPERLEDLRYPADDADCKRDFVSGSAIINNWFMTGHNPGYHAGVQTIRYVSDEPSQGDTYHCWIIDTCSDGNCPQEYENMLIDAVQYAACLEQLISSGAQRNLECFLPSF